jgi:two-component system, OmpR family, sensor histidine kinase TctE
MKLIGSRSLQLRLALRLSALFVIATTLAVGVLLYQAYDTASTLNDRELNQRAEDIARAISRDATGAPQVGLPQKIASAYATSADDMFAVRDADGKVLAASPSEFGQQVSKWPMPKDDPSYFRITHGGSGEYYGVSVQLSSAIGLVSVSVARAAGTDVLVQSLLREFVVDIAWVIPLVMVATLIIGVFLIRNDLNPVREISEMAAAIGPQATSVRLPNNNLPTEIRPLVEAVNHALDRLESGFEVQRQFTANAAHELRTPLAIITGALDGMVGNGEIAKLKSDVARMNRLVDQLLRVARLDAVALQFEPVNLSDVARSTVEMMAPWAIAQGRTVAFLGTDDKVEIEANGNAVEDALRNLVENGVMHSPSGAEVTVTVHPNASVSIADHGSGIPLDDRERIFDRFWRGKQMNSHGAGLGLAIVSETMKAHGGSVCVRDNNGGGAIFTLVFSTKQQTADQSASTAQ